MNKKIFIACDTTNHNKVKKIIQYTQSKKLKIGYKFGLEFFYSKSGRSFLSKLSKKQIIFLDLKLNDIPNTCISAINALKDIKNIRYLTAHINGGYEMLKTIKKKSKKINKKLKILGVTVLTSFSDKSLKNAINQVIEDLDGGKVRVAEKINGEWLLKAAAHPRFQEAYSVGR